VPSYSCKRCLGHLEKILLTHRRNSWMNWAVGNLCQSYGAWTSELVLTFPTICVDPRGTGRLRHRLQMQGRIPFEHSIDPIRKVSGIYAFLCDSGEASLCTSSTKPTTPLPRVSMKRDRVSAQFDDPLHFHELGSEEKNQLVVPRC
jgi:hypothetical protein